MGRNASDSLKRRGGMEESRGKGRRGEGEWMAIKSTVYRPQSPGRGGAMFLLLRNLTLDHTSEFLKFGVIFKKFNP